MRRYRQRARKWIKTPLALLMVAAILSGTIDPAAVRAETVSSGYSAKSAETKEQTTVQEDTAAQDDTAVQEDTVFDGTQTDDGSGKADTEVPETGEEPAGQPESGTTEQPDSGNTGQPDSGNTEQPDGGNAEQPDGGSAEQPDGENAEQPDSESTKQPDAEQSDSESAEQTQTEERATEPITSTDVEFIGRYVGIDPAGVNQVVTPQYPVEFTGTEQQAVEQFHTDGFVSGTAEEILKDKAIGKTTYGDEYKPVTDLAGEKKWTDKFNIGNNGSSATYGAITTVIGDKEQTVVSMKQENGQVFYVLGNDLNTNIQAVSGQKFYLNYYNFGYGAQRDVHTSGNQLSRGDGFALSLGGENKNLTDETLTLYDSQYVQAVVTRPESYRGKISLEVLLKDTDTVCVGKSDVTVVEKDGQTVFRFRLPSVDHMPSDQPTYELRWSFASEAITSKNVTFTGRLVGADNMINVTPIYPVEFAGDEQAAIDGFHTAGFLSGSADTLLNGKTIGYIQSLKWEEYKPITMSSTKTWTDKYNVAGGGVNQTYGAITTRESGKEQTVEWMEQVDGTVFYRLADENKIYQAAAGQNFYLNYYLYGYNSSSNKIETMGDRLAKRNFSLTVNGEQKKLENETVDKLMDSQYIEVKVERPLNYKDSIHLKLTDKKKNTVAIPEERIEVIDTEESVVFRFKLPDYDEVTANDYSGEYYLDWEHDFVEKDPEKITGENVQFIGRVIEVYESGKIAPVEFMGAEKAAVESFLKDGLEYGDVEAMMSNKGIGDEYDPYVSKGEEDSYGCVTTVLQGEEYVIKELYQFEGQLYYILKKSTEDGIAGVMVQAEKDQIFYLNYSRKQSAQTAQLVLNNTSYQNHSGVTLEVNGETIDPDTAKTITVPTSMYVTISVTHPEEYEGKIRLVIKKGAEEIQIRKESSSGRTDYFFKIDKDAGKTYTCGWGIDVEAQTSHLIAMYDENSNLTTSTMEYDAAHVSQGSIVQGRRLNGYAPDFVASQYVGTTRMTILDEDTQGNKTTTSPRSDVYISDSNFGLTFGAEDGLGMGHQSGLEKSNYRLKTLDSVVFGGYIPNLAGSGLASGVTYAESTDAMFVDYQYDWVTGAVTNQTSAYRNLTPQLGILQGSKAVAGQKISEVPTLAPGTFSNLTEYVMEGSTLWSDKFTTYNVKMKKGNSVGEVSSPTSDYKGVGYSTFHTPKWENGSQSGKYPTALASYEQESKVSMEYDFQWGYLTGFDNSADKNMSNRAARALTGASSQNYASVPPLVLKYESWAKDKHMIYQDSSGSFQYDAPKNTEYVNLYANPALQQRGGIATYTMSDGATVHILVSMLEPPENTHIGNGKHYKYKITVTGATSDVRLGFQSTYAGTEGQKATVTGTEQIDGKDGIVFGKIWRFNDYDNGNGVYNWTGWMSESENSKNLNLALKYAGGENPQETGTGTYEQTAEGYAEKGSGENRWSGPKFTGGEEPKNATPGVSSGWANYYAVPVWVKQGYKNPLPYLVNAEGTLQPNLLKDYWYKANTYKQDIADGNGGTKTYVQTVLSNDGASQDSVRLAYTRIGTEADGEHEGDMLYMYYVSTKSDSAFRNLTFKAAKLNMKVCYLKKAGVYEPLLEEKTGMDLLDNSRFLITEKIPSASDLNDQFLGWKVSFHDTVSGDTIVLTDENDKKITDPLKDAYHLDDGEYLPNGAPYQAGDFIDLNALYEFSDYALARYFAERLKVDGEIEVRFTPIVYSDVGEQYYTNGEIQFRYQTLYEGSGSESGNESANENGYSYQREKGDKETKLVPVKGDTVSYPTSTDAIEIARMKSGFGTETPEKYPKTWYRFNVKNSILMSSSDAAIPETTPDGDGKTKEVEGYRVVGVHSYDRSFTVEYDFSEYNDAVGGQIGGATLSKQYTTVKENQSVVPFEAKNQSGGTLGSEEMKKLVESISEWKVTAVRMDADGKELSRESLSETGLTVEQNASGSYELDLSGIGKDAVQAILKDLDKPVKKLILTPVAGTETQKKPEFVYEDSEGKPLNKDRLILSGAIAGETFSSGIYETGSTAAGSGLEIARMYFKIAGEDMPVTDPGKEIRQRFKVVWERQSEQNGAWETVAGDEWMRNLKESADDTTPTKVFYDNVNHLYYTPLIVRKEAFYKDDGQGGKQELSTEELKTLLEGKYRVYVSCAENADEDNYNAENSAFEVSDPVGVKVAAGVKGVATIPDKISLTEKKNESGAVIAESREINVKLKAYSHNIFDENGQIDTDRDTNWNTPQSGEKTDGYLSGGSGIYQKELPFDLSSDGAVTMEAAGISEKLTAKVYQKNDKGTYEEIKDNGQLTGKVQYGTGSTTEIFSFLLRTVRPRTAVKGTLYHGTMMFHLKTTKTSASAVSAARAGEKR